MTVNKSSKINPQFQRIRGVLIFSFFLLISNICNAQLDQLSQELDNASGQMTTIAGTIITIVKIIAGIAIVISAIRFAFLKDQQSDLAGSAGKLVLGLVIFFALISFAETLF